MNQRKSVQDGSGWGQRGSEPAMLAARLTLSAVATSHADKILAKLFGILCGKVDLDGREQAWLQQTERSF
jgi:hypothetical protein